MNTLQTFIDFWWHWSVHMFWQVALLILLLTLVDVMVRDRVWPQVRYGLWLLVLVKLLIPPGWSAPTGIFSQLLPDITIETRQAQTTAPREAAPFMDHRIDAPTMADEPGPSRTPQAVNSQQSELCSPATTSNPVFTVKNMVFSIWLAGMVVFALLLVFKMVRLRQWHKKHNEALVPPWFHTLLVNTAQKMNIDNLPAIVFSPEATSPAVYGLFKPTMLLPAQYFDNIDRKQAEHILLHELAHIKRGDLIVNAFSMIVQMLYWYNPLVHWSGRQVRHVREICCDLTVAQALQDDKSQYRQTLINTARTLLTESPEMGLAFLGIFEEPFRLVSRIRWLEKPTLPQPEKSLIISFITSMLVVFLVLPMSGMENLEHQKSGQLSDTDLSGDMHTLDDVLPPSAQHKGYYYTVKQSEPFYAIVRHMDGPVDLIGETMHQLQDYLQNERIRPEGPSFIINKSIDYGTASEHVLQWGVGYPVARQYKVSPPYTCKLYPERTILFIKLPERHNGDALNLELTKVMGQNRYITNGPILLFCPDKLYKPVRKRQWKIHVPIEQTEQPFPQVAVQTTWSEPMLTIIRRWSGPFAQEEQAKQELLDYLQKKDITPVSKPFYRYMNDELKVEPKDLQWEVGVAVPAGTLADFPYVIKHFPSEKIVTGVINCKRENIIPHVYGFAIEYMQQGLFPAGYPMRYDLGVDEQDRLEMKFRVPVRNQRFNQMDTMPSFY